MVSLTSLGIFSSAGKAMVQETIHDPALHCEPNTLSVRAIIIAGVGLAVITALGMALMAWMFASLAADVAPPVPLSESMLAVQPAQVEPRLEPNLGLRLQEMRQSEAEWLRSYAWIDPKTGIARIPIDRAVQLLVAGQAETQLNAPPADAGLPPSASADRLAEAVPAEAVPAEAAPAEAVPAEAAPANAPPAPSSKPTVEPAAAAPAAESAPVEGAPSDSAAAEAGSGAVTDSGSSSISAGEVGTEVADQAVGGSRS
jgi:hypothetical protein